jgi:hypothetical protein
MTRISTSFLFFTLLLPASAFAEDTSLLSKQISQNCFRLGASAAFSEMVRFGVKKLALSTAVSPEEMNEMIDELRQTIAEQKVQSYLETDLIVTDLFPADIAKGKHLMLIYKGTTLEEYLALKKKKEALVLSGNYSGKARKDIAREFGRLLSYSDSTIEEKIK